MRQAKRHFCSRALRSPGSTRDSLLPFFCLTQVQTDLQYLIHAEGYVGDPASAENGSRWLRPAYVTYKVE